ncbi:MAG: KTSC domain-containing protein [Caulobacteraceae bacterium]
MPTVDSSAVREIDYDPATERLRVRFVSGARYVYQDVPAKVGRAFLAAASKGRYFAAKVRDRYAYRRLD